MSKDALVIILGFIVMVTPFLGLPSMWKAILLVALGLLIATLAFLLRQDVLARGYQKWDEVTNVYVENGSAQALEVPRKELAEKRAASLPQSAGNAVDIGSEVKATPKKRTRRTRKVHVEENT